MRDCGDPIGATATSFWKKNRSRHLRQNLTDKGFRNGIIGGPRRIGPMQAIATEGASEPHAPADLRYVADQHRYSFFSGASSEVFTERSPSVFSCIRSRTRSSSATNIVGS